MSMKRFFGYLWVRSAARCAVQPICQAKCFRHCVLAVALQYLPFGLEAAPLASEIRSEVLDGRVNALAGTRDNIKDVAAPMGGGWWDGSDSAMHGGAEGDASKGQPVSSVTLCSKRVNGKPGCSDTSTSQQPQVSDAKSDAEKFHLLALLCFFGPHFLGMLWYLWRPTDPFGKTPNV